MNDLRSWRLHLALSVADLATDLGVHPTSIHRWERRERLPGPTHIVQIARRLELPTQEVARFFDAARPAPAGPPPGVRGTGLRSLRRRRGLGAAQIADALGVPTSSVYNWESGRARIPDHHLAPLAALLGLAPGGLRESLRTAPAQPVGPEPARGLRRLRQRCGLSQARVAELVGVSRRTLGSWERGARPPLHGMRRLAETYGLRVSEVAAAAGVTGPRWLDRRTWQPGDLPRVLRVLREWSGLTQRELAERIGCSRDAARAWESGRGTPRRPLRRRLEQVYGLPPDTLLVAYPARTVGPTVAAARAS